MTTVVLSKVSPQHAGAAAGVLSAVQQVGNSLGVELIGVVFFGGLDAGHPITQAFRSGLLDIAVLTAAVAGIVQLLPRDRR